MNTKEDHNYEQETKTICQWIQRQGGNSSNPREETVLQLALRYGIYPTQINSRKRHLIEQAAELFAGRNQERSIDDLRRVIGQLTVKRGVLAKKLNHWVRESEKWWLSPTNNWVSLVSASYWIYRDWPYSYYYRPQPIADDHLALLSKMDEQYLRTPQYGSRSYATWFQRQGILSTSAAFIEVL